MLKTLFRSFAVAGIAIVAATGISHAQEKTFYKMGTFPPGTSVNIIHTAWANAVNRHVPNAEVQLSASGPATRHMLQVAAGDMDFSLTSMISIQLMGAHKGPFKNLKEGDNPAEKLSIIFAHPIGARHYIVFDDSPIQSFADFKGKKVFLGPPGGTATQQNLITVKGQTGYEPGKDFELVKLNWGPAIQAFQDRKYDVMMLPGISPDPRIQQIALTSKIRVIGVDEARMMEDPGTKKLLSNPMNSLIDLAPDAYGANQMNTAAVKLVNPKVALAVRADMDADVVYAMTKAFWENIEEAHALAPWMSAAVSLDEALFPIPNGIHPGALRYYKEKGLTIPDAFVGGKRVPQ